MDFPSAIRYPFQNLPRVISIVLVMTIALSICLGLVISTRDWSPFVAMFYGVDLHMVDPGASTSVSQAQATAVDQPFSWATLAGVLGLLIVAVVSGFWISGYSLEVVRSIMNGSETLPGIDFGRNMKDGFYLFVATLAYCLIFAVISLVEISLLGLTDSAAGLNIFVVLASVIVSVVALALMGWAYFIGMGRFASEGDYKASWQIFRNIKLARENWREGLKLLMYMIALTIIYGVVRSLLETALGGFIGAFGMASITFTIVIYYIFNLLQHFSSQHLIAQFAVTILDDQRLAPGEKDKHDFG